MSEPDAAQQAIFDQGHEVGAVAKQMFPDGIEVGDGIIDLDETIRLTTAALKLRKPLFEAAFSAEGGFCRVDILRPAPMGSWDIVEVKSTTSTKDVHLHDLAFQSWVLTIAGLRLRRCFLCHVNPDFVRRGQIDPNKFFTLKDVTAKVSRLSRTVEGKLGEMFKTIGLGKYPDIQIGQHCDNPYRCALHDLCWDWVPSHSVLDLRRGRKKGFALLDQGIALVKDIPDDIELTANQAIQKETAISGKPHVKKRAISKFLDRLKFPLHYLDFETFGTAIPLFDGLRPYQQVPFQFSLHLVSASGAEPQHRMFLAQGREDPRPEFMRQLRECVADQGSVVVYNAAFEKSRLRECADFLPEHAAWVRRIERRFVDLLKPFRSFHYYHPSQNGSASIKSVLPALTGNGYENLQIQDGSTASLEFLRVTFADVSEDERQRVRRQLEEYCRRDTEGMVWILAELEMLSRGRP